ncbi:MAG: site-specific integrase [Clostridia bacterium]|nr:site-specific integrase [Clostridia bacterium]
MSQKRLTKRADGRYKVNYGGKQFYGKTKAEAVKKRDEYIASENIGLDLNFAEMTFLDYGLKWLRVYRSECGISQQKQYIKMVEFTANTLHNKHMRNITVTDMQGICNSLSVYSASHVAKYMSMVRGIFKTAVAEGALIRNPMDLVKRPKCKKTEGHRALDPWERDLVAATYTGHEFGLCAMVMLYAGLRRGEALYIDVDRDVDFVNKTITVRGAVSFSEGNQPQITDGKTEAAQRTIPLVPPLADALRDHHGLLCTKGDGTLMTQSSFDRKFESYKTYLETKLNGCHKRWYGKTKEHKAMMDADQALPDWREVTIRCHDFRVDFCTRCYYAGIPLKTLQSWMGHSDAQMILEIYSKLTKEQEATDAVKLANYMTGNITAHHPQSLVNTAKIG